MKDRKIIVIKLIAGSNTPIKEEINDELEVYQEFVGGNIEIVTLGERLAMVVNDEGLIRELPENIIASILYWSRCGRVVTPICGNAMLVGIRPEDEGEFGSVPPSALITVELVAYQAKEYEKRAAAEET